MHEKVNLKLNQIWTNYFSSLMFLAHESMQALLLSKPATKNVFFEKGFFKIRIWKSVQNIYEMLFYYLAPLQSDTIMMS